MRTNPFGVRNDLRGLTIPAAVAYVLITVLTLLAQTLGYVFALLAEITERLADAGNTARTAAAEHSADTPPVRFPRPTTAGTRR